MSNKPLKASDQRKLKEAMTRKTKQIEKIHQLPAYTIIFSEADRPLIFGEFDL